MLEARRTYNSIVIPMKSKCFFARSFNPCSSNAHGARLHDDGTTTPTLARKERCAWSLSQGCRSDPVSRRPRPGTTSRSQRGRINARRLPKRQGGGTRRCDLASSLRYPTLRRDALRKRAGLLGGSHRHVFGDNLAQDAGWEGGRARLRTLALSTCHVACLPMPSRCHSPQPESTCAGTLAIMPRLMLARRPMTEAGSVAQSPPLPAHNLLLLVLRIDT